MGEFGREEVDLITASMECTNDVFWLYLEPSVTHKMWSENSEMSSRIICLLYIALSDFGTFAISFRMIGGTRSQRGVDGKMGRRGSN